MPWRACSKTASRKTSGPLAAAAAVLLTLLVPTVAAAQELTITGRYTADDTLHIEIADAPTGRLTAALADGMRAEVDVILRVFERVDGLAGMLGDELIAEEHIATRARWDPFAGGYRLSGHGATVVEELPSAVDRLLSISGVPVPPELFGGSDRYLRAQARLRPLRLAERLRLIALALPRYTLRSAWTPVAAPEDRL